MPEVVQTLSPLVRRITADNPSVFTGPGTNTYLVGAKEVTVIDPGPAIERHIEAITNAPGEITQIIVTHTHPDHSPGTSLLQKKLDIPAYGLITNSSKDQDVTFNPKSLLADQQVIRSKDFNLIVLHTPGHASNHLCFLLEQERMLFTGDHIMNGATVVIPPPDGNMTNYISSLKKLRQYEITTIAPGHGELMGEPHGTIEWIIQHRLEREEKVLFALQKATKGTADSLVESVYSDIDRALFPFAKWSLESHLIKLLEDGCISKNDDQYVYQPTDQS